jgi:hypothetical protein
MSIDEAHTCAATHATEKARPDRDRAREIRLGWYFPWRFVGDSLIGSNGIIVDKRTRRVVILGSAYPVERDLRAYDAGYPLTKAHLLVTAVADQNRAVSLLQQLRVTKIEPEEAHGVTLRIPQPLSSSEIRTKLVTLPVDFGVIQVYFSVELLERARQERCFLFELQEAAA